MRFQAHPPSPLPSPIFAATNYNPALHRRLSSCLYPAQRALSIAHTAAFACNSHLHPHLSPRAGPVHSSRSKLYQPTATRNIMTPLTTTTNSTNSASKDEDIASLRLTYTHGTLLESSAHSNPLQQFKSWFAEVKSAGTEKEVNAMCISTCDPLTGRPSGRMVLLKELDSRGFVFYTNYRSRKSIEINSNPFAALTFFWSSFERSVRIEGKVEKVSAEESDVYFTSRPRGSRIGAWASPYQSSKVAGREEIENLEREVKDKFGEEGEVERPEFWGGWRVVPDRIEFWQGRPSRLHDRILYTLKEDEEGWDISRLSP
ncbi:hypothetical protein HDV05_007972 [Chytridiales sp. JEL 0842]|nr:hypothetical protein HDV05_007972 [Chytridiales sp. JEL 0842]